MKQEKQKTKKTFLGFFKVKQTIKKEEVFPLSKHFLKRYKKIKKEAFDLSVINKKNEE